MALFGSSFSDPYSGFPDAFDADEMRRQAMWRGVQQMGLNLMSPDPNVPPSWGGTIGRAAKGFAEGADEGRKDYESRGLTALKMQKYKRDEDTEKRKQEALTELLSDTDLEPGLRNWIMANPDHAWDVIKTQFETPKDPKLVTVVSPDGKQRRSINVTDPKARAFLQPYLNQGWTEAGGAGGSPQDEYGLQPIVTQDKDGKYHLFQANKGGGPPKEIPLPYGWTPQQQYLDTGTGFQAVPRQGVGSGAAIPKDVAGEAAAREAGAVAGKAQGNLPGHLVEAQRTVDKINELLMDPNLGSATGWQGYVPDLALPVTPGAGPTAYTIRTKVRQLIGKEFMQAYETLKGGGVITEIEGEKATDAYARMQSAQSDQDFVNALVDFRDAVQSGVEKMAATARQPAPQLKGMTGGDPLAAARDAISRGADPDAVRRRLIENGIDPSGL